MNGLALLLGLAALLSGCATGRPCANGNTWNIWTGCRSPSSFSLRPAPTGVPGPFTQAILRDPVSGQTVNCTLLSRYNSGPAFGRGGAIGSGLADGLISAVQEASCVNNYRAAGFQPLW